LSPGDLYAEVHNIAPDLLVYLGDLAWRSIGTLGNGALHVFENDTGPDDANHAQYGLFVLRAPAVGGGVRVTRSWRAMAPTMLELLGMDVPVDMSEERLW